MDNIIEMTGIVKVFPPNVVALDNVSAGFRKGEIHAIVGENGAGKSTLMKVLYGMEERNAGEIIYRGKPVHTANPVKPSLTALAWSTRRSCSSPSTPCVRTWYSGLSP